PSPCRRAALRRRRGERALSPKGERRCAPPQDLRALLRPGRAAPGAARLRRLCGRARRLRPGAARALPRRLRRAAPGAQPRDAAAACAARRIRVSRLPESRDHIRRCARALDEANFFVPQRTYLILSLSKDAR